MVRKEINWYKTSEKLPESSRDVIFTYAKKTHRGFLQENQKAFMDLSGDYFRCDISQVEWWAYTPVPPNTEQD